MVQIQSQLLHLTDTLPDDLPALLELPLALEQGRAASTHTTTEEEEDTDEISGLDEDLQRYQFTQIQSLTYLTEYQSLLISIAYIKIDCFSLDRKPQYA